MTWTLGGLLRSYIQLTKPTIVLLVAITGLCAMAAEGSLFEQPIEMLLILLAIVVAAGAANSLNQFVDRDIDAVMERTRSRRPLPQSQLSPNHALAFGLITSVISTFYLWWAANAQAALISLGTILFYVLIYTLWLKRRHHYNIVIGGAAGATAPLIASAAYQDKISAMAWFMFLLIFFWTPPHFWALALAIKDQYEKVKIPMLPNVRGDRRTIIEIYAYTVFLLPLTLVPIALGMLGWLAALLLLAVWAWYMKVTVERLKEKTVPAYRKLFVVSIFYLFLSFVILGLDGMIHYFQGLWVGV